MTLSPPLVAPNEFSVKNQLEFIQLMRTVLTVSMNGTIGIKFSNLEK